MKVPGVEGGSQWDLRWSTRWKRTYLGHKSRSPDALCKFPPPPLTPFLWVMNVSVTKLADCRSPSVAVGTKTLRPKMKEVSSGESMIWMSCIHLYKVGISRL